MRKKKLLRQLFVAVFGKSIIMLFLTLVYNFKIKLSDFLLTTMLKMTEYASLKSYNAEMMQTL